MSGIHGARAIVDRWARDRFNGRCPIGEQARDDLAARFDDELARLQRELDAARELLADVAASGIAFEDDRIDYLEVQIDRVTWDEVQRYLATEQEAEKNKED